MILRDLNLCGTGPCAVAVWSDSVQPQSTATLTLLHAFVSVRERLLQSESTELEHRRQRPAGHAGPRRPKRHDWLGAAALEGAGDTPSATTYYLVSALTFGVLMMNVAVLTRGRLGLPPDSAHADVTGALR